MKYELYGKDNCPGCVQLEALLKSSGIEPEVKKFGKDFDLPFLQSLFEGNTMPRTFPILFKDGKFVGGLAEARKAKAEGDL
jgi:glutaredoxin